MQVTDEMVERAQLAADALNVMVHARAMRAALTAALSDKQAVEVKKDRVQAIEDVLSALTAHELYQYRPKAFEGFIEYARATLVSEEEASMWRSTLVDIPAVEPEDTRLYDGTRPMSDGGDTKMTAAEEVLAWLLIEKIGVPDDVCYSPGQAQEIIVRQLSSPPLSHRGESEEEPTGLSVWSGWDQSRLPWSQAKHQDAVCAAVFGPTWSMEDAAVLIGFINRTWKPAIDATRTGSTSDATGAPSKGSDHG